MKKVFSGILLLLLAGIMFLLFSIHTECVLRQNSTEASLQQVTEWVERMRLEGERIRATW